MKVCVVCERRKGVCPPLPKCDVALFGFSALGQVDYSEELSGKTEKLQRMAKLSQSAHCGVFCGCVTDSKGLKRKSVACAAEGKLLGISDMVYVLDGDEYKSGAGVGVYSSCGYKVGVCIGNDLLFPEHINVLAMCGCNLIAAFTEDLPDGMTPLLIRAYAYLYGIPVVLSAGGTAFFADITGVIVSSNRDYSVFETSPKNCYRSATFRRRGGYSVSPPDY